MIENEVMGVLQQVNEVVRILTVCLFHQAEARAEFAERSVQKLQKEVDRLEGKSHIFIVNLLYWSVETGVIQVHQAEKQRVNDTLYIPNSEYISP
jgi:hypothetical protein